jgi:hypothetical protein
VSSGSSDAGFGDGAAGHERIVVDCVAKTAGGLKTHRAQGTPGALKEMPFDAKRMFWGGLEVIIDLGAI